MVTEAILTFFFGFAQVVLGILPTATFDLIPAASTLATIISGISTFMPMTAVGICFGVFATVQGIKLASSIINWVLRKFLLG